MELKEVLRQSGGGVAGPALDALVAIWAFRHVEKGAFLCDQGEASRHEYVLLDGCLVSRIDGEDGRSVSVGLSAGPAIIPPHVARSREGHSLVALEATTDVLVAETDETRLAELMIQDPEIATWGNTVLREELARKTDREWCLAALGGADRLAWFRTRYPGFEDRFGHARIASFLGMTAVTLSRLRRDQG